MLRVIVEVVPEGDESRKRTLGTALIWNATPEHLLSAGLSDYEATVVAEDPRRSATTRVRRFDGTRRSAWALLALVLGNVSGDPVMKR